MEVIMSRLTVGSVSYPLTCPNYTLNLKSTHNSSTLQVLSWKCAPLNIAQANLRPLLLGRLNYANVAVVGISNFFGSCHLDLWTSWKLKKRLLLNNYLSAIKWEVKKYSAKFYKIFSSSVKRKCSVFIPFVRLVFGAVLVMSVSVAVSQGPSWSLSEENRLFLEAWRTLDRAYVDKTFNGLSWFRYRENALRNEPMNSREETYMAIRKMVATLNDPFTRFLEPEKLRSLRSGTQSSLTGVGLSIGYPTEIGESSTGVVVISAAPGGPANRAGILPGDVILAIDDASTDGMGIYDAANFLQGPEGSSVDLTIRSRDEIKHVALKREKVTLNPVRSRLCELPSSTKEASPKVGYIKLTSFTENASDAVREAIDTLRSHNVNAFVLDLRDNSGGLFPQGIEMAKIWGATAYIQVIQPSALGTLEKAFLAALGIC
ncbi:Carboxyl-terminal-processing peptidase 2 chloroplastic [Bienertia sinuspersici]